MGKQKEDEKVKGLVEYSNLYAQYVITKTRNIDVEGEPLGDYVEYVKVIWECV